MDEEKKVWEGSPSQIINLPAFLLYTVIIAALAGGAYALQSSLGSVSWLVAGGLALLAFCLALWKWLATRCQRYELSTERLHLTHGIFSRQTEAVELYRIKDYLLVQPFWMRVFGLGNVVLTTTDDSNQKVLLKAVPGARSLWDQIRNHVEACREKKRVRVSEFEQ